MSSIYQLLESVIGIHENQVDHIESRIRAVHQVHKSTKNMFDGAFSKKMKINPPHPDSPQIPFDNSVLQLSAYLLLSL